ncbi:MULTISPECIES: hypothetical protein [Halorubrum]|uniref:hypothetical protein n=1 Tax=Halorubrum TaxID=56688 RepID=UPI0010F4E068|nr:MULTISPECIES: hypothetical protein [Halorubrum]TKX35457.1 hypothetical protein EXE51_14330 [Halorubrum sp. CGM5_25_10-8B]
MNRRAFLATSAIGTKIALSGCLFGRPSSIESKEHPEAPDELDEESAIRFAKMYEEVTRYNEYIQNDSNIIDLDYDCYAAIERQSGNAFCVVVQCAFSVESRDESGRSTGEGITNPTLYYLTRGEFIRAETKRIRARTPTESSNDRYRGIRLVNFSQKEQTVEIEIAPASSRTDSRKTQFSETYTVRPHNGFTIERAAISDGIYFVTVTSDNSLSVTHEWEVPGQDGPDLGRMWSSTEINLGAYILPNGELEVRDIPEQ